MKTYPIAPGGIFDTVQGEGALLGVPMAFVRLAGCSVGCPQCDTDYGVAERLTVAEVVERLQRLPRREWAWVTGGEPTDHDDLGALLRTLACEDYKVALATSGVRPARYPVDFLSVSPHDFGSWVFRRGHQLNLVPGLNGLRLADWPEGADVGFPARYVTPLYGSAESLAECLAWVQRRPGWKLGVQAHRLWGLP